MSVLALDRHRRKAGPLSSLSASNPVRTIANNPAPSAVGAVIGTSIFNSTVAATEVLNQTIQVGSVTAALATTCQFGSDTIKWWNGRITGNEIGRRVVRNVTVNSTAVVGGTGGSAVGGAIGTAILPGTGTVVGSIVGGVFGSISFGTLVNQKFEDWWRGYHVTYVRDSKELLDISLRYFGYTTNDLKDYDTCNMETMTTKYREYAKVYHPDKGGTKEEWIALVNHFAIVTDAIRKRDRSLPASHKGSELGKLRKQAQEREAAFAKEKQNYERQIQHLTDSNQRLQDVANRQVNNSNSNQIDDKIKAGHRTGQSLTRPPCAIVGQGRYSFVFG